MAKFDQYHPNYKQLYPSVELTPEVLDFLDKSDRKIEYTEVDLKVEGFIGDQDKQIARFLPSREDSYDRLLDEERQFALDELSPEDKAVHEDELRRLRVYLALLSDCESRLIRALYFEGLSERQLSVATGTPQKTINNHRRKILGKLRKMMDK